MPKRDLTPPTWTRPALLTLLRSSDPLGIRYEGAIAADGGLTAPPERLPAAGHVQIEPRLTERIVERCLETGARIAPANGAAAAHLADANGIAALLRW